MAGVEGNPTGHERRTLRARIRASARRARAGGDGGLAGRALAHIRFRDDRWPSLPPEAARSSAPRVLRTSVPDERRDQERVDGFDDDRLLALRHELDVELERLAQPPNDEAPDA